MDKDSNLYKYLEETKNRYSEKIAVIAGTNRVTYSELYMKSYKYSNYIMRRTKDKITVCVISKRSVELIACVLGIIRSGCSYLLFEPEDVNQGMMLMVVQASPGIIFAETYIEGIGHIVLLDQVKMDDTVMEPPCTRKEKDLLYLVSTSGTTRDRKIIMVEDRNILCYISAYIKLFAVSSFDIILQQSPVYYDGFAEEIFSMLLTGGTIILADTFELKSPRRIREIINEHSVTILPSTPLMLNELNKLNNMPSVKTIISSGDVLRKSYIVNLLAHSNVYNMYGLTETTVCVSCYKCGADDEEIVSIGREIEGYEIAIYDEKGEEIKDSEVGEIFILGNGVTRGYLGEEGNERYCMRKGQRAFRTGDYAWRDKDGSLHYTGRKDRQIKIRGNKVHLDQVESIIAGKETIDSIAVSCYGDKETIICAFYVSLNCAVHELRTFCRKNLPFYMRPVQYIKLDKMPVSGTGKTDYQKLQEIYENEKKIVVSNADGFSDVEKKVVECILTVLEPELQQIFVSLEMSWEELGLNSLEYINFILEIEQAFKIDLEDEWMIQERFATVKDFCRCIGAYIHEE